MKIRDTLQPTVEREVDEGEYRVLKHQGLIWSGTPEELAALYEAAGLPAPTAAVPVATPAPVPAPAAPAATTTKEATAK